METIIVTNPSANGGAGPVVLAAPVHVSVPLETVTTGGGPQIAVLAAAPVSASGVAEEGLMPPPPPPAQQQSIDAWLASIELGGYSSEIKQLGYESLTFLREAHLAEIEEIIRDLKMKRPQARRLIGAWTELANDEPSSLPCAPAPMVVHAMAL
jgi:hypothetical protein